MRKKKWLSILRRVKRMKNFKKVVAGAIIGTMMFSSVSFADFDVEKLTTLKDLFKGMYKTEVSDDEMMTGAIQGMLSALDKYSVYYPKDEVEAFENDLDGRYVGIGVIIAKENEEFVVKQVIEESPAEYVGILPGVKILKIDGVAVKGLDTEKVSNLIKGESDTEVTLNIDYFGKILDVTVWREKIDAPSIDFSIKDTNIGYIAINSFDRDTSKEIKKKLELLDWIGYKDLIIDLRYNAGGYLVEGLNVAKMFVPEGNICVIKDKQGNEVEYKSELKDSKYNIIVLTNGYTASASEILASALKESGAAVIVGKNTYGKGCIQQIISLGDLGKAKVTIADIYTRNGNEINEVGVSPDYEVNGDNEQLLKAIELFRNK